jgi:hypothetical protein
MPIYELKTAALPDVQILIEAEDADDARDKLDQFQVRYVDAFDTEIRVSIHSPTPP